MNPSNIPDLCLLEIFDRVPLQNLLSSIALVCRRWNYLIHPSSLARRPELQFWVTNRGHRPQDPDCFNRVLYKINENEPETSLQERLDWIRLSFCSLSSVSIFYKSQYPTLTLQFSLNFIVSFSPRLVKLSIVSDYPIVSTKLYFHINQCMPQLRELTLEFPDTENFSQQSSPEPLPVLKQLRQFRLIYRQLSFEEYQKIVFNYLQDDCKRLVSCELDVGQVKVGKWLKLGPKVAKKITAILEPNYFACMDDDYLLLIEMRKFFNLYTSLTHVTLFATEELTVVEILKCMCALKKLKSLKIWFDGEDVQIGDLTSLTQVQLPSLCDIDFDCTFSNHGQLHEWFNFHRLFPRLETVRINFTCNTFCTLCWQLGKSVQECAQALCDAFSGGDNSLLRYVEVKTMHKSTLELFTIKWEKSLNFICKN